MARLTLNGEVVADFPDVFLGDMIAIADQIERVNAVFAAGTDNIVQGLRAVPLIIDLVNALQAKRKLPAIVVDLDTLPRADQAEIISFYFDLLLVAGLQKSGEAAPGTKEADLSSAAPPLSPSDSPSESNLSA